jgi:RimJ/RimL family protein N-acetyltransferase
MDIVLDRRKEVAAFVGAALDCGQFIEPYQSIGFARDGRLIGGQVYEGMTAANIHVHIAGHASLLRGSLRVLWNYVFQQLGCLRLTAIVRADHPRMPRILPRLGFRREGVLRRYFTECDALVFGLLADEAPAWMRS